MTRSVFTLRSTAPEGIRSSDRAERFRAAMLPHRDAAFTFARYLTRDPQKAEDVVQEAYLSALRGFDGWRGDAPKSWLLAIVRNCFLASVANDRARPSPLAPDAADLDGAPDAADHQTPEAILARREDIAMIRAAVEALPEPFREALVLRELQELSYKEIATITGAPIGTVMSRLARARQMLEQRLRAPTEGEAR